MDPTEQTPLLSRDTWTQPTNTAPQPTTTPNPDWKPSSAELQLLYPADISSMFSPLRSLFLPRLSQAQLLQFFNRPAGPRIAEAPYAIRLAKFSDIPQTAMLQAKADWKMPVMRIFHPRKDIHPRDYLQAYWESNLMWMSKPGALTYVAVRRYPSSGTDEMGGMEEVIGAIRFSRHGDGKARAPRQYGFIGLVVDYAMRVWMRVVRSSWVKPLRSKKIDTEAQKNAGERTVEKFESMEKKYWSQPDLKERYYVGTVCVKDDWRGRGVGKALMAVATERCVEEKVPLTLSATEDGVWLYRKMGFEMLDEFHLPGGGVGSRYEIMVWDPRKRE